MARRESSIYKRKDGRWEARFIIGKDEKGKSVYRSVYGKSYHEAREKRRLATISMASNEEQKAKVTFDILSKQWLEKKRGNVKESTFMKYQYVCDRYLCEFNEYDISMISDAMVEKYMHVHADIYSDHYYAPATMKLILSVFKMIIKHAETFDVKVNCHIDKFTIKSYKGEVRYLSKQEQIEIEEKLKECYEPYAISIWLGLYTGMRLGEICALQWKDIDLEQRIIHVRKTLQRIRNKDTTSCKKTKIIITDPKTNTSKRDIPIPKGCYEQLLKFKPESMDAYVLTGTKKYMEPRGVEYHFDQLMKEWNIENIHFHCLRHTFTTRCLELGFEVKTLSEILGHSSVSFTLDRYGHSSLATKVENMNKLQLSNIA